MKIYLWLFPVLILSLLQAVFLPLNLVLLAVLVLATLNSDRKSSIFFAFLSGLILDLAKGTTLGVSSFLLLVACCLSLIYSRKFDSGHPIFLAIFAFLSSLGFSRVVDGIWGWKEATMLGGIGFVLQSAIWKLKKGSFPSN